MKSATIKSRVSRGVTSALVLVVLLVLLVEKGRGEEVSVQCVTEDGRSTILPSTAMNDNYCDCPLTGIDEPDTAACAGSRHWPGETAAEDNNDDDR